MDVFYEQGPQPKKYPLADNNAAQWARRYFEEE
jgi:hypothetical protein